jgi:4-amino-4-deoxy-L-arabinose transferase-like glycosyltransferase
MSAIGSWARGVLAASPRAGSQLRNALRVSAWVVGVMLAFLARRSLEPPHTSVGGWLLYAAGAVLILVALQPTPAAAPVVERTIPPATVSRVVSSVAFGSFGLALALVAYERVRNGYPDSGTTIVWAVAVVSVLFAVASMGGRPRLRRPIRVSRGLLLECVAFGAVLVLAIVLRIYELGIRPANVHPDEALIGLDARGFLTGENTEIFTTGFAATPRFSYAIPALAMRLFGDDLFGVRMSSVILGVVAVVLLYGLARQLFGIVCAIVASSLLAVSQWAVHYSRVGTSNEQAVVATLLVIFLAVRAADRNRLADWLFTGLAAGLCFEVYQGARLAPFVAGGYVLHRALRVRGFLRARLPGVTVGVLAAFVFFAPMAGYYARHPEKFNEHGREVQVWTAGGRVHEMGVYRVDTLPAILLKQSQHTVAALNGSPETAPHYAGVLTDELSGPFVVLGLLIALPLGLRDPRLFLIGEWSFLTLAFGAVTINALASTRVVGAMGAFCLAAASVVELGWQAFGSLLGPRAKRAFAVAVFAFLAAVAAVNIREYFERYPAAHPPDSRTILGQYARTIPPRSRLYLLPGAGYSIRFETIRFLAPSLDGRDLSSVEPDALPADRDALLVVPAWSADATRERRWISERYAVDSHTRLGPKDGPPYFDVYEVKMTELTSMR